MKNPGWYTDEALTMIRYLQCTAFLAGYNLHLGGSVLNKGFSENDLDIMAVRRPQVLKTKHWLLTSTLRKLSYKVIKMGNMPGRYVVKFECKTTGRKIDLIRCDLDIGQTEPYNYPDEKTQKERDVNILFDLAQIEEQALIQLRKMQVFDARV